MAASAAGAIVAAMSRSIFLTALAEHRAVAILRARDHAKASAAMRAAVDAGFRVLEFTMTTPGVLELIGEFARDPRLVVGAGTVLRPEDAGAAVRAGARFLVSPVMDEGIIACARGLGVDAVPGCATPTEMWRAHQAGAAAQKLFPAPGDVAAFVRSVLAPLPELRIVPTNGVHEGNVEDVLRAGAVGVGFTTPLFDPAELEGGVLAGIGARAERLLGAVGRARRQAGLRM